MRESENTRTCENYTETREILACPRAILACPCVRTCENCTHVRVLGHARIARKRVQFSHVHVFSDSRNVHKRATKPDTSGHCLQITKQPGLRARERQSVVCELAAQLGNARPILSSAMRDRSAGIAVSHQITPSLLSLSTSRPCSLACLLACSLPPSLPPSIHPRMIPPPPPSFSLSLSLSL